MTKHTQTILWQQPTNCLSAFDHFVGLALKVSKISIILIIEFLIDNSQYNYCIVQKFQIYKISGPFITAHFVFNQIWDNGEQKNQNGKDLLICSLSWNNRTINNRTINNRTINGPEYFGVCAQLLQQWKAAKTKTLYILILVTLRLRALLIFGANIWKCSRQKALTGKGVLVKRVFKLKKIYIILSIAVA